MDKQAAKQELTDRVKIEFDDDKNPIVTEVVLDKVAAFLFEQIEEAYETKQKLPDYSFLHDIASAVVGGVHAAECIKYMQDNYPDDLAKMRPKQ